MDIRVELKAEACASDVESCIVTLAEPMRRVIL